MNVIISITGRRPTIAAPTPTPVKPDSQIGVSMTRLLAEVLEQPLGHLVGAVVEPDLLAHEEDARVALHLLAQGLVQRFAVRDDGHGLSLLVHVGEQLFRGRLRRGLGELHRLVHPVEHVLLDGLDVGLAEEPVAAAALA